MKKMKKLLSVVLSVAMMLGLLISTGSINLTAGAETTTTWVDFEPQLMDTYSSNGNWYSSTSGISEDYLNVGGLIMRPHTNGYAAIRRFDCTTTGTMYLNGETTTSWGQKGIYLTGGNSTLDYTGATMDFCIVNQDHELLWPTDGKFHTFTYGDGDYTDAIQFDVTTGDSIYFIATNPTVAALSLNINVIAYVGATGNGQIHYSGQLRGTDLSQQGVAGTHDVGKWYYMYAPSVSLTTANPNGYTDEGQDVYEATYTTTPMNNIQYKTDENGNSIGDPNNGWIGGGSYGSTTFAQSANIYPHAGETAIVRYTAPTDGYFSIGYCGVELMKSTWTAEQGVDFAIVNQDGEVLYPEYGGAVQLRGTGEPSDEATVPSRLYVYNMEAGDYLDFVYKPTATVPTFGTAYVTTSGSFSFNGSRIDSSGRLALYHTEAQGTRNVQMLYSTDFEFGKRETSEWTEFVQLESALTAAPATVEAWVNIPEDVKDWKTGTILSDATGADATGYTVMMDTFGHPRLVSGNVDWTVESVDLRNGTWTHIAFTADGDTLTFYLNGEAAATTTVTDAALATSGEAAVIGNDLSYAADTAFVGAMKKLALFSDARTADEIAADVEAVSASAEGLIGYWVLNGEYSDKSSVGNDGTLTHVGGDWYDAGAPVDAADDEYTIIHIGDMQVTTDFLAGQYPQVTQWIAANAKRLNVQAVINSGDLVNNEDQASQWEDAVAGMDNLKNAGIPIVYATGNHEFPSSGTKERDATTFNKYFKVSDYFTQGTETNPMQMLYAYPNTEMLTSTEALTTETMENAVYVMNINGEPHIFFCLEVQPRITVVNDWAIPVMKALEASEKYADAPVTVITHHYLTTNGQIDDTNATFTESHRTECYKPTELYNVFVSQYKNITTVLCGHVADDIATRSDIGVNGNKIVSIMNDQSYEGNGGEGTISIMRYKTDGTVQVEYYSPILDKYYHSTNQFTYDTAAGDDLVLNLSSLKEMQYYSGSAAWASSSGILNYVQTRGMKVYKEQDVAVIRTYQAEKSGTMNYCLYFLSTDADAQLALCREDGTILWPTEGTWQTYTGSESQFRVTNIKFPVEQGEKIHFVLKSGNTANSASISVETYGTITPTDGSDTVTFNSYTSGIALGTTQGENGWYAYYATASDLTMVPKSHTVTWGCSEGGTISSSTSGTYGATAHTVPQDGTVWFAAKPDAGYRIAGYYVNGKYTTDYRQLTLSMISADTEVYVKFAKIKVEGDANGDGEVDILDLVNLSYNNYTATDECDITVCDLEDTDIIDVGDFKALREKLLG